jgi:Tfp pilus assembly protein PilN
VLKRRAAITINFAGIDYGLIVRLQQTGIAVVVMLALSAGSLFWSALSYRSAGAAAEQQVTSLADSAGKLRMAVQDRQQLIKNLNAMTALLEARRHSWTQFLTGIEAAFPAGIALTRVDFERRDRTALLEGVAQSPEALSNLMIGLQRSRSFRNPLLKHQSMDKGILSFNVAVIYQEPLAAGQDQGAGGKPGD